MAGKSLNYRRGRSGRPWERAKARIKADATNCGKCGKSISAEYTWPHPRSVTVGHILPLDHGGESLDPDNLQAECIACNMSEGARMTNNKRGNKDHSNGSGYANPNW